LAQWIADGEAPCDLWDVDLRRFGPFTANRRSLAERTRESLGLHYAMRWPRQELETGRPLRTSPLYDLLAAQGAEFGSKNGWERVNYVRRDGAPRPPYTLDTPGWLPWLQAEMRATREAVALYDQSSFGKLMVQGRDALVLLQRLCANQIDVTPGRMVYTALLNRRGGFESDLTVMRLAADRFLVVTGSAQPNRDLDWLQRHAGDAFVTVTDVSAQWCVLSLMGPNARDLLARVSPDDLSPAGLKFAHTKEIDLGLARVRAARMSYVGGPGFELYVPCEMARHVYGTLHEAGADLGLTDAGYYALDALRIEAGRRAWGAELGPDETPWMAGLGFAVALDKGTDFTGRDALLAARDAPLAKKLVAVVLDASHAARATWLWGGEPVVLAGESVGELSSAGYSLAAARCIGLGYFRGAAAAQHHAGTPVQVEVWGEPVAATAWDDVGAGLKTVGGG
jgi:4-methylaminobutanoate oxidase (formaldehyde-forming)